MPSALRGAAFAGGRGSQARHTPYINSPGESARSGLALYGMVQFIPCDVATVARGFAASMGQMLLSAGAKGKRSFEPAGG
ncbi:hypothetical protein GCM10022419_084290 [Nonomuraea rosea]|uniref:ATP-dependent Clp protease proteolytic subunit n=1 Tax=Nonomuraea rosea TaxID=638574 RepID=A0ABP6YT55_9ACTN